MIAIVVGISESARKVRRSPSWSAVIQVFSSALRHSASLSLIYFIFFWSGQKTSFRKHESAVEEHRHHRKGHQAPRHPDILEQLFRRQTLTSRFRVGIAMF